MREFLENILKIFSKILNQIGGTCVYDMKANEKSVAGELIR